MSQAESIAKLLLDIKAVTLDLKQPFRYTSGILSPIYCDNRLIISYPKKRQQVIDGFISIIKEHPIECDVIAGTATAGIAHAAWIAQALNKPMVYVRSKAKGHGKHNQIEGYLEPGQKALIIEDLVSTGGSAINAGIALREAGAIVTDCLAIFNYEMHQAMQAFKDVDIRLHTLSDISTLLNIATQEQYITEKEQQRALEWNIDPQHWGAKMGYE